MKTIWAGLDVDGIAKLFIADQNKNLRKILQEEWGEILKEIGAQPGEMLSAFIVDLRMDEKEMKSIEKHARAYLETLDNEMPEERWLTPCGFAKDELNEFIEWLKKESK